MNFVFALEDFDIAKHTGEDGKYCFGDRQFDFVLKYKKFEDELSLLKAYFQLVQALKPLIVLAHNGEGFDYAYLWKKTAYYGLEADFSPFGKSNMRENIAPDGKVEYKISAPGVFYMDSISLYKKFAEDTRKEKSYSLDYLCELHLGERKVNHDCYRSFDGFRTGEGYIRPDIEPPKESLLEYALYNAKSQAEIEKISKEWFIHYSIVDTYLLYKLINRVKIVDVMVNIAATMGCQINQSVGVITPWSIYMRNFGLTRNQVMPDKDDSIEYVENKGGFVKEPNAGKYGWTFSVDVTSMYPSQIMAFNISADTYVPLAKLPDDLRQVVEEIGFNEDEETHLKNFRKNPELYAKYSSLLQKYNLCGTLIGTHFRKDFRGILPTLVEHIFNARKADKQKMLEYQAKYEETKGPADKDIADRYYLHQLTKKILSCAIYGANGNPNFILFNEKIVGSITGNSRFYVNLMASNIENHLQSIKPLNREYLAYIDTDSVVGETQIKVNGSYITIEEFYDSLKFPEIQKSDNNFIKNISGDYITPSVTKDIKLVGERIKYIKKHKVKKELFRVYIAGKEVVVTSDHSVMVLRDGKLTAQKVRNICENDYLIKVSHGGILDFIQTKRIDSLGIQEEWVYDIEVEKTHNFFGNDILVHNSNFFMVPEPLIDKSLSINDQTDKISDWIESDIQPLINKASTEIGDLFNALDAKKISAKREGISDAGVFIAKKRYFMRVWDSEFIRYKDPYLKSTGIDLIRSSTPKFSQKYLKEAIDIILDKDEAYLRNWVQKVKSEYKQQPLMDIARTSAVSNINYNLKTDKGVPINSRAFIATNSYIHSNKLENKYQSLIPGEKIKLLYLKLPNPLGQNVYGFADEKYASVFKEYIDWDLNFEKFFLSPLELMIKPIGYNLNTQVECLDLW